jgi:hypothetical protein
VLLAQLCCGLTRRTAPQRVPQRRAQHCIPWRALPRNRRPTWMRKTAVHRAVWGYIGSLGPTVHVWACRISSARLQGRGHAAMS